MFRDGHGRLRGPMLDCLIPTPDARDDRHCPDTSLQTSASEHRSLKRSNGVTIPHQVPREARLHCIQMPPSCSCVACLICTNLDLLTSLSWIKTLPRPV